jgi:PAS domain S-box-containing protein
MPDAPIRILLVEDNPRDAELTLARLKRDGIQFTSHRVVSRDEFVQAVQAPSYDIILADYVLPGFDGLSAMKIAREICPQIPFIFVSGGLGEEIAIESLKQGATDYVLKQNLERLTPAVTRALADARERAERKRIEEALEKSEERLRLAVQSTQLGTWDLNIPTLELNCNERVFEMLGLPVGTPLDASSLINFVHADDRLALSSTLRSSLSPEAGGRFEHEFRLNSALGDVRWIALRGQVVFEKSSAESPKPVRAVGTALDITQRKQAELELDRARREAEAASRAKDHFLAILSHELRTPLSPVIMTVQLMELDPDLTDEMRKNLNVIRRNAELEARLIDDLLDLTRITRGKLQLNLSTVDVHTLIDGVIEICTSDIRGKRHQLDLDLRATDSIVNADPARLQQVLWNLVKNAVKFTPAGGRITVRSRDAENDRVVVEVSDTGIGIPPESIRKIFTPFEQAEDWITRRYGGLGLGLTIAKALAEKHGGSLGAFSEGNGKGATFVLELPLAHQTVRHDSSQPFTGSNGNSLQILLVEDHKDTAGAMAMLLQRMGYNVAVADSVESALGLSAAQRFDLLISDIGLPDGTGLDIVSRWDGRHRAAPSIALTGFGMDQDVARCRAAGFTEHLTKPVNLTKLEAMIRSMTTKAKVG